MNIQSIFRWQSFVISPEQFIPLYTIFKQTNTTWKAINVSSAKTNSHGQQTGALLWRHNGRTGISNHQPHDCLLNRSFGCRSKKTSKLCVTGLYVRNSPVTDEFPAQMDSNAKNVFIWWRHHGLWPNMDDSLNPQKYTPYPRVTLYPAGHLHTAVPHCSHSRAPIVHTAVRRENNEHGCVYLRCRAVCKLPGCVEGHPWYLDLTGEDLGENWPR